MLCYRISTPCINPSVRGWESEVQLRGGGVKTQLITHSYFILERRSLGEEIPAREKPSWATQAAVGRWRDNLLMFFVCLLIS